MSRIKHLTTSLHVLTDEPVQLMSSQGAALPTTRTASYPQTTERADSMSALQASAKRPKHSSASPPPPSLVPKSAVWYFSEYLRSYYQCSSLPVENKWPPTTSNDYNNVAIINRECTKAKEHRLFKRTSATPQRDIDHALEKRTLIPFHEILDMPTGKKPQCVLMEGSPGVGKTTLCWEFCKRWGKRKIYQQYLLVLLLRVRDEQLHPAKSLKDLILYSVDERKDDILQYFKSTKGKHTLIILEGIDELPRHLFTPSNIYTRILSGTELPDATLLLTCRPPATSFLWDKWRARISKHVEILGFTTENITNYVASVHDSKRSAEFYSYVNNAPSLKRLMHNPLHSVIVLEMHRMFRNRDKPMPTKIAAMFAVYVQTILTRYLAEYPKYKNDMLDVDELTDLPWDIYPDFKELASLAYIGVVNQRLFYKKKLKAIEHMGFMDAFSEVLPLKNTTYRYSFLDITIQEYLGAYSVSLMEVQTQERLLETMFTEQHLKNMGFFLAVMTKFKGMDKAVVKSAIQKDCQSLNGELTLSEYALQMAYESEDVSILEGHQLYTHILTDYSPLPTFTAMGYCIANSNFTWHLQLGSFGQYMQSTKRVKLLVDALGNQGSPSYTIKRISWYHVDTECVQSLLSALPQHTLPLLEMLELYSETLWPLPQSLSASLATMSGLRRLTLRNATADTLASTLQILAGSLNNTLEALDLMGSEFSLQAMQNLCTVLLNNSESMCEVWLCNCSISDDQVYNLASILQNFNKVTHVNLSHNDIHNGGAHSIAQALQGCAKSVNVNVEGNPIDAEGYKAFNG